MTTTPFLGATDWAAAQASPWLPHNAAIRMAEALARAGSIEDRDLTAPPGSCADGACYLVAGSPTGAWSGKAGQLAVAVGTNAASGWLFIVVAVEGTQLWVKDEDLRLTYDGSAWVEGVSFRLKSYTVAGVPSAVTRGAGAQIYVSNESGGAVPAFSDGTDWRRVTDRAVIS